MPEGGMYFFVPVQTGYASSLQELGSSCVIAKIRKKIRMKFENCPDQKG
jgi:hypothetical protein